MIGKSVSTIKLHSVAWRPDNQQPTDLLPVSRSSSNVPSRPADAALPALVVSGGSAAQFAWEEFIYGQIRNPHTRAAYERAIRQFLTHCELLGKELANVSPRDVGSYLDGLDYAAATKKLHLSGIRHFFDTLVTRHVVVLNPAASVRGERLQVVEGKTPEISVEQARVLIRSIDPSNVIGLRDRAIIGILIYTAARVGAVAKLRRTDFYDLGVSVLSAHRLAWLARGSRCGNYQNRSRSPSPVRCAYSRCSHSSQTASRSLPVLP